MTTGRAEPHKPAVLEFLLEDSEAIRLLGSARRAQVLNDPRLVSAIDYFSTVFLHCTNVFAASTCTTTSNQASPRLTWLILLVTAHPVPPATVPPLGTSTSLCCSCITLCLKLVLFMYYIVLIMNTTTCHAITFSLIHIMNRLLNYESKICRTKPRFLTGDALYGYTQWRIHAWASRAMALGVGLKSPREVTVPTRSLTQLADYICGVALGVGWAFVRPWLYRPCEMEKSTIPITSYLFYFYSPLLLKCLDKRC
jgi:hypothetical protein